MKIASQDITSNLLDKKILNKVRLKAIRSGAWFSALQRIDRVLFDLTIRVADSIRSATLAKKILIIIQKLEENVCGGLSRALRTIGFFFARKLSLLAQRWGNTSAKKWACDFSFLRFLTIMYINVPRYSEKRKSYIRASLP